MQLPWSAVIVVEPIGSLQDRAKAGRTDRLIAEAAALARTLHFRSEPTVSRALTVFDVLGTSPGCSCIRTYRTQSLALGSDLCGRSLDHPRSEAAASASASRIRAGCRDTWKCYEFGGIAASMKEHGIRLTTGQLVIDNLSPDHFARNPELGPNLVDHAFFVVSIIESGANRIGGCQELLGERSGLSLAVGC